MGRVPQDPPPPLPTLDPAIPVESFSPVQFLVDVGDQELRIRRRVVDHLIRQRTNLPEIRGFPPFGSGNPHPCETLLHQESHRELDKQVNRFGKIYLQFDRDCTHIYMYALHRHNDIPIMISVAEGRGGRGGEDGPRYNNNFIHIKNDTMLPFKKAFDYVNLTFFQVSTSIVIQMIKLKALFNNHV